MPGSASEPLFPWQWRTWCSGKCVAVVTEAVRVCGVCRCDREGESGVLYVVRLAVHLLDPSRPESSAAFIGRLLIVFFKKVSREKGRGRQGEDYLSLIDHDQNVSCFCAHFSVYPFCFLVKYKNCIKKPPTLGK